jgi:hypothetical protein
MQESEKGDGEIKEWPTAEAAEQALVGHPYWTAWPNQIVEVKE